MIRPATAADGAAMAALWDASARAGFGDLLPPGQPFPRWDPERLRELLDDERVHVLVHDDGGELLGHTTFGTSRDPDVPESVGEVRSFFVSPSAWRRGIGTGLMARALAGLAELGFEQATLWSFEANARANSFYERHGFERDGTTRTEAIWGFVPEVRYRRTLSSVRIENLNRVEAFVTLDGSEIREVAGIPTGNAVNQSLAEATVHPGGETLEHFHRTSEEIYFFTHGAGRMRLGDEEQVVGPGDTVVIAPGTPHKLWCTGEEPLRLLCCCAPGYSDADTVITEPQD